MNPKWLKIMTVFVVFMNLQPGQGLTTVSLCLFHSTSAGSALELQLRNHVRACFFTNLSCHLNRENIWGLQQLGLFWPSSLTVISPVWQHKAPGLGTPPSVVFHCYKKYLRHIEHYGKKPLRCLSEIQLTMPGDLNSILEAYLEEESQLWWAVCSVVSLPVPPTTK